MTELLTTENLIALVSLASLEIVLGIDNLVFIAITSERLPVEQQSKARKLGLAMAMVQRLALLMVLSWIVKLTEPLFSVMGKGFSGRDLILLGGGLFLMAKAVFEIHGMMEGDGHGKKAGAPATMASILVQITILDLVFSLDSVITAVGMVNEVSVMVTAVLIACVVMIVFANPISSFILKHPTIKMLALSFLLLIGVVLVADGFGQHIEKGYIYFAMGFAILVEAFNFRMRARKARES